jgi:DNA-binding transcriptional regulator YdaS (Cro superfamily)
MDNRLDTLKQYAASNGASVAVMNALSEARLYSGILDAVVRAGSLPRLADKLGVSYQAVQQWVKTGYVPLARIPEIESLYGVSRADLMNPKYAAALAPVDFSALGSFSNVPRPVSHPSKGKGKYSDKPSRSIPVPDAETFEEDLTDLDALTPPIFSSDV